jgi:hypothetical protein
MNAHNPVCPSWTCAGCAGEWPCPTRREQLRAEYADAWVSLNFYLAGHFVQACGDLPQEPAGALYARFFGWLAAPGGRSWSGPVT